MAERVPTFKGAVGAFRSVGVAATDETVLSIFNKTGSGVLVAVRRLTLQVDQQVALTTAAPHAVTTRLTTAPTTGTLLTPQAWDTSQTHNASVEIRSRASADGTNGTLTATPGADRARSFFGDRPHTIAGQRLFPDKDMLPDFPDPEDPLVLREGQGVLVTVAPTGSTSSHYLVNAMIEEFTYAVDPLPFFRRPTLQAVNRASTF